MGWPGPVLLAEVDPDGGTIGAARAAATDPGLKTLAAAGRHYLSPGLITSNTQTLEGGLAVLMSPPSPDRCVAALAALNPVGLGQTLRDLDGVDVIADCGRIDSHSPALPVVLEADAVIFVVRPTLVDIVGLRGRLETLELPPTTRAGVAVVDSGPHGAEDVAAAVEVPVVGRLDWDPKAAAALKEGRLVVGRSPLLASAKRLAVSLAGQLDHADAGNPEPGESPGLVDLRPSDGSPAPTSSVSSGVPSPAWSPPRPPVDGRVRPSWEIAQ
jgi:hypothetical protein